MEFELLMARGVRLFGAAAVLVACSTPVTRTDASQDASSSDAADASTVPPDEFDAGPPEDVPPVPPLAHWVLPRSGPNSFMLPWPSDLTLTARGTVDLRYVPNDVNNSLVRDYVTSLEGKLAGFSNNGATYFRFSVPIDPATLPVDAASTLLPAASVQLIDIDPASPSHGQRQPAQFYFRPRPTRYWTPNTLAVAPVFGFPLRAHNRYAIVVTNRVRALRGAVIARDADLTAVLAASGGDAAVTTARAATEPSVVEVERAGVPRAEILSLAVFTTQDPTAELFRAVTVAHAAEAPRLMDVVAAQDGTAFQTYTGHYGPNANFQSGPPPFTVPGSGDFTIDPATGNPVVQRMENIRFALTVPVGTPPAAGWPIAIYAHGTGGDSMSFIADDTAATLAARGIAVIGFDMVFNGERIIGSGTAEAQFFNFQNPLAGRTNNRQGALDLVTLGRLVRTMRIPAAVSYSTLEIAFDPARVMFFGHSQGGLNGPLWLAAENGAGAAVLSGAGGTLSLSLTQKIQPINVPNLMAVLLGIPTAQARDELVPLHPIITLAQTAVDVCDPVNYARFIVREPRAGNPPKHIYQTQGFIDNYTPPDAISSLGLAMGNQLAAPVPHLVEAYPLTGMEIATLPVSLNASQRRATAVWQQFNAAGGRDGHFVIFNDITARNRSAEFLRSFTMDPMHPTVQP